MSQIISQGKSSPRFKKAKFKGNCWLWPYAVNKDGYGKLRKNKQNYEAHRFMYQTLKGNVSEGLELDHTCKNKLCVNPEHLEPVTHAVNCQRKSQSKLDQGKVNWIRKMAFSMKHTEIANRLGVSRQLVSMVILGKRWPRSST